MNRLTGILLGFLLAFALFSCSSGNQDKSKDNKAGKKSIVVEGYVVKPTVLDQTIMISGTLKPFEETVLMPDVPGRVVSVNLPEGTFVKKGTLLVKLFDEDLKANLKKLNTQLEIAEQTLKRQNELLKVSGISELEYDQTELQVNSIKDDIEILQVQIRKTEVIAPFDGIIGLRNVSVGAQITSTTPLTTIREIDRMKLDFSVPEKYSREVKEGKKVQFTVQGDDTKYEGRVMATEESIEADTRNLKVRAVVDGKTGSLKPGAYATVELALAENKDALMVPTQSIIPQERNKKVILVRNGKAAFTTVKTGVRQSALIEILEGVAAGDTVVTTGILFLKPDQPVKLSKLNR